VGDGRGRFAVACGTHLREALGLAPDCSSTSQQAAYMHRGLGTELDT
jgi:hypothetical protein